MFRQHSFPPLTSPLSWAPLFLSQVSKRRHLGAGETQAGMLGVYFLVWLSQPLGAAAAVPSSSSSPAFSRKTQLRAASDTRPSLSTRLHAGILDPGPSSWRMGLEAPSTEAIAPSNTSESSIAAWEGRSGVLYRASTDCGDYESGDLWPVSGGVNIIPFLGIRYARPMDSSQRWMPPSEPQCSPGTLFNASDWGQQCVQLNGVSGSEDCLVLNVFVPEVKVVEGPHPRQVPTDELLPVFVYLHGGGLVMGTSNGLSVWDVGAAPQSGGGYSVVVSGNYRLNSLGFLATAELSQEQMGTSGNYGILDQQLMLQWVQKDISSFGGDPNRVTVIGQSSGGTSIFALLSSPLSRGLFHRAISLSGSPNVTMDIRAAEQQNAPIVDALGCGNSTDWMERLACMRAVPASEVAAKTPTSWTTPGNNGLPVSPEGQSYAGLPIVDGRVLTMSFSEALREGLVDVPLILSSMQHETNGWSAASVSNYDNFKWADYLQQYFQAWPRGEEIASNLYSLYQTDSLENPQKAYDAIVADYSLTCGNIANGLGAVSGSGKYQSPIYVVLNQWAPGAPFNDRGSEEEEELEAAAAQAQEEAERQGEVINTPILRPLRHRAQNQAQQYAFHTWDLLCWIRAFPQPVAKSDVALSKLLRNAFYQLAVSGRLDNEWLAINGTANWPQSYAVYVIRDPSTAPFLASATVQDHKNDVCTHWASHGISQASWWCD